MKKEFQAGTKAQQRTDADISTSASVEANPMLAVCPIRVQRKRVKGYRMPENTKSVTRPGKFGNPYKIGKHSCWLGRKCENIDDVMKSFRMKMNSSKAMQRLVKHYLKGKNLACFCPVLDKNENYVHCHADYLLSFANNLTLQEIKDENIKAELRKKP